MSFFPDELAMSSRVHGSAFAAKDSMNLIKSQSGCLGSSDYVGIRAPRRSTWLGLPRSGGGAYNLPLVTSS